VHAQHGGWPLPLLREQCIVPQHRSVPGWRLCLLYITTADKCLGPLSTMLYIIGLGLADERDITIKCVQCLLYGPGPPPPLPVTGAMQLAMPRIFCC
jgi:hypothetical protein